MKRIGIDAHMLGDNSGGNERYYENILKNMDVPEECRIFIFMKPGIDTAGLEKKYKVIRFKSHNSFVRNFIELPILAKKLKLDILHTQYFIPFACPCDTYCTIHDICFEHFKDIFTKKEYIRQKLLIPYAAKHSKKVFTVSEYSKKDIADHYKIPEENIIVTYNAVGKEFRKLNDKELDLPGLRTKFGISADRYLLSVCNLQPRKNLVRLIKAFISMKQEQGGAEQLVIVGKKAWMYNDIISEAMQDSKDIIFTDYVSNDDLIRLYNGAHCFVYPSFFEGFGIPPLEAMACGTPVAVSNATSLPEVVGDAGIYFDPFSVEEIKGGLKKILRDDGLRAKLINKGYERINKYNWEESADIVAKSYVLQE